MDAQMLRDRIARRAEELGFQRVGFARAGPCRDRDNLEQWVAHGHHADMDWMARGIDRRTDPRKILPAARTVISLLTFYGTNPSGSGAEWVGRISRYAWGADYHQVLQRRMKKLIRTVVELTPGSTTLGAVDHRPVLEKEWAERSGLGWIGKHTNLITTDAGSWFFLSELVTDLDLAREERAHANRCGRCTDCIDACPTRAIVAPYQVDSRRCISYLTIELAGPIPRELRPLVGEWIFGCDVCQDVCPWNRFATPVTEPRFQVSEGRFRGDPAEFLSLSESGFRERFEGSPVRRAGRDGFLRNVCVSLGNRCDPASVPALALALADLSPLVREHAAWALGRIGGSDARRALAERAPREDDRRVEEEIAHAQRAIGGESSEGGEASGPAPSRTPDGTDRYGRPVDYEQPSD